MYSNLSIIARRLSSISIQFDMQMKQFNDQKKYQQSIDLFEKFRKEKTLAKIPPLAIDQAIRALIELKQYQRAIEIEQNLSSNLIENVFIRYRLIRLHMKSGNVSKAKNLFETSTNKSSPMYTVILTGLIENNKPTEAFEFFRQINSPDEYLYSTIFKLCTMLGDQKSLEFGKNLFHNMSKTLHNKKVVLNSALNLFNKCGDIAKSEEIFSRMEKDLFSYSIMMQTYLTNGIPQKAIDLFFQIKNPDQVCFSILFGACAQLATPQSLTLGKQVLSRLPKDYRESDNILYSLSNMFIKCNDLDNAESLFNRLNRQVKSYGSLMKLYQTRNEPEKILNLFERMKKEKVQANEIIYVLLIDACSALGDLSLAKSIISQIPKSLINNLLVQNSSINMWGKCGSAEEAKRVFDSIDQPDEISYSSMINAFGLNGMGIEAVRLFNQVPNEILDIWIYVCVLNACSHSGLVHQAKEIFEKIPTQERTNQICTTMVDVLSRANLLDEAQRLVQEFEENNPPCLPMYMSILSGVRNQHDACLSQKIFDRMKEIFSQIKSDLTSARVLLANTYASNGDLSTASHIRMEMEELHLKKQMGISKTIINGRVQIFRAQDASHPDSNKISEELKRVYEQLVSHGYVPDPSWITRDIKEGESVQSILWGHSEKLAIGLNLIQNPVPSPIQVVKNLRICGDCHSSIKLITKIRQCEIIVRDANRIHHFYPNGQCSCNDYF